jgi:PAS domain S-box-containing protein
MTSLNLQDLVTGLGDAVVDASGAIVLWNPAATRIFGFSQDEALGKSLDLIIPERLKARHWEGYHKTMGTGITRYGADLLRVPAVNKAGTPMSIAFTVSLLHNADGSVAAIASVIRDETQRFNDDRALKKQLADLQAQVAALTAPK